MKFKFFIEMFSGENGISSKRSVMIWLILLFTATIIVNLCNPAKALNEELRTQLFELVIISIGVVFGEPAIKRIAMRGDKTDKTKTNE